MAEVLWKRVWHLLEQLEEPAQVLWQYFLVLEALYLY